MTSGVAQGVSAMGETRWEAVWMTTSAEDEADTACPAADEELEAGRVVGRTAPTGHTVV